jgi:hypothetical protein
MLTDKTLEEILRAVPNPEKPDWFWLNYMRDCGFTLSDVRNDSDFEKTFAIDGMVFEGYFCLPRGDRYYCSITIPKGTHAVAIDEQGLVFDPSTSAPMTGACTLEQYVRANFKVAGCIFISCCYRVQPQRPGRDPLSSDTV